MGLELNGEELELLKPHMSLTSGHQRSAAQQGPGHGHGQRSEAAGISEAMGECIGRAAFRAMPVLNRSCMTMAVTRKGWPCGQDEDIELVVVQRFPDGVVRASCLKSATERHVCGCSFHRTVESIPTWRVVQPASIACMAILSILGLIPATGASVS